MDVSRTSSAVNRWPLVIALAIFVVYAFNFLYFFVDDEGIPFVYAQNVLRGRGLVYATFEGRVEGYSDFLHVVTSTLILAAVKGLGWPKVSVFFVGKALAFLAGTGCIVTAYVTIRSWKGMNNAAATTGLTFLALSGPLAVWSCSSLETASFALLVTLLTCVLLAADTRTPDRVGGTRLDLVAAAAAVLMVLERIDGVLIAGAILSAFLIFTSAPRRRLMLTRVVLPTVVIAIGYHAWRLWYFGDLLNMPLRSKVVYKLEAEGHIVTKSPDAGYLARFVAVYGRVAVAAVVAAILYSAWRQRAARPLVLAIAILVAYASIVSDWMFGFRFFVMTLPLVAVVMAISLPILIRRRMVAWIVAAVVIAWCGISAAAFERDYERVEKKNSWLFQPSFVAARYFGTYGELLETASPLVGKGQVVTYNQAGFVPFMLDLENIDDLGICSKFYAALPTRDVFFTEVGRYVPFHSGSSFGVEVAYLLYRDVPFVIARGDLLRAANGGRTPSELFGGFYERLVATPSNADVIYKRTARDASEYRVDPSLFSENVVHVANLTSVRIDGLDVRPQDFIARFPYLHEATAYLDVKGPYQLDAQFSADDIAVSEIEFTDLWATRPASVRFEILNAHGDAQTVFAADLPDQTRHSTRQRLPEGARASRFRVLVTPRSNQPLHVWMSDLRLQGQSKALADYVHKKLKFPAGVQG